MKIIFLDFDGVMDTAYYDHVLAKEGKPSNDEYGIVFDPNSIRNLKYIIDMTGADIVVTSSWKYMMNYQDFSMQGQTHNSSIQRYRRNKGWKEFLYIKENCFFSQGLWGFLFLRKMLYLRNVKQ